MTEDVFQTLDHLSCCGGLYGISLLHSIGCSNQLQRVGPLGQQPGLVTVLAVDMLASAAQVDRVVPQADNYDMS